MLPPASNALSGCEVRTDPLTRQLYATDASIYQIEPAAVAFPRSAAQAGQVIRDAAVQGMDIICRGAGTGLAGGAIGKGLIVDFARHNCAITGFDREARTVRVGAGVVLDQLNSFLAPHGLMFGPDVATSSRATLGGMIANNSSGAHCPLYGTTADHLTSLEVVLADGRTVEVGGGFTELRKLRSGVSDLLTRRAAEIDARMPPGLLKRWPGYGLDRALRASGDLALLLSGSEGTLAGIFSAALKLVETPRRRGLGVLFFPTVPDAMQATVELLDLKAAAIEHIDRPLFDQTRGKLAFRESRGLMGLDADDSCDAILLVEFFDDDIEARLAELERRRVGVRRLLLTDAREQALVWQVRKAGLTLLTSRKGPAKPIAGIEDVAVKPEQLPAYVAGLRSILDPLGVEASFYGHAAAGLLHVRPVIDLHTAEGVATYRHIANEVSALVRQVGGSIAAEHGVGIARSEYLPDHLGPELMDLHRRIKALFDPRGVMNPGKIIPGERLYRTDEHLRQGAGSTIELPFAPALRFFERDGSFVGNLEQCNGNGACLKQSPTMCPTYLVTHDEIMSTRGRANTIRAVLEERVGADLAAALKSPELDAAMTPCLSCKACKNECPSNVDMALLKAELSHAKHRRHGVPLADRVIASADLLGRIGSALAPGSNLLASSGPVRWLMSRLLGMTARRPLPPFAAKRFDRWFERRRREDARERGAGASRGRVILWDDTWVRYHEPHIGMAAVKVLEAAGFEVTLPRGRRCCGRPAFSRGLLDEAAAGGRHNVGLLAGGEEPIIFLEPSCQAMFIDEYRQLGIDGAAEVASRCLSFEHFMMTLLEQEPQALAFAPLPRSVAIHAHCHAEALTDVSILPRLAAKLPGARATLLDTACCGMAGAYGMMETTYDLSLRVAEPMVALLNALPPDARLVASGTSCRHQITHLTGWRPLHMAELLAEALQDGP